MKHAPGEERNWPRYTPEELKKMEKSHNVKHTPGPWYVKKYETHKSHYHSFVEDGAGQEIADCGIIQLKEEIFQEASANVLLIAAAPDLLEACKNMLIAYDERVLNASHGQSINEALKIVQQATAKAEGRE